VSVRDIVIVASGGANIASLQFALQRLNASAEVSADPERIRAATRPASAPPPMPCRDCAAAGCMN
jgi:hypothetical protein